MSWKKLKDDNEEYKWERKELEKGKWILLPFLLLLYVICELIYKKKWWVFVVSGRTAGEGQQQQQQGNASRTFTAGRYLVPISALSNNYFLY